MSRIVEADLSRATSDIRGRSLSRHPLPVSERAVETLALVARRPGGRTVAAPPGEAKAGDLPSGATTVLPLAARLDGRRGRPPSVLRRGLFDGRVLGDASVLNAHHALRALRDAGVVGDHE